MLRRNALKYIETALRRQAAVALIGPRQVGKTTLAFAVAEGRESLYLDLETAADRAKLQDIPLFLNAFADRLVILDEVHRVPDLFAELRGVIDAGRRQGRRVGRFLLLGSAGIDLLRQSGESLAGRIEYVSLTPLDVTEIEGVPEAMDRLWTRGGLPESFLAADDGDSLAYRQNFIRTYLERDIPAFGVRVPAETLRRLWTMLAHGQGAMLNASKLGASLQISSPTLARYIDLLVDLLLVRRLPPVTANVGKRLVKSPKVYIRDSGLVHALLGLKSLDDIVGHPVVGASWEGFAVETLLNNAPEGTEAGFYRTAAGAEMDLVLDLPGNGGRWCVEVKRSLAVSPTKGFHNARADLAPDRCFIVHAGTATFPVGDGVEAIGLGSLAHRLRDFR